MEDFILFKNRIEEKLSIFAEQINITGLRDDLKSFRTEVEKKLLEFSAANVTLRADVDNELLAVKSCIAETISTQPTKNPPNYEQLFIASQEARITQLEQLVTMQNNIILASINNAKSPPLPTKPANPPATRPIPARRADRLTSPTSHPTETHLPTHTATPEPEPLHSTLPPPTAQPRPAETKGDRQGPSQDHLNHHQVTHQSDRHQNHQNRQLEHPNRQHTQPDRFYDHHNDHQHDSNQNRYKPRVAMVGDSMLGGLLAEHKRQKPYSGINPSQAVDIGAYGGKTTEDMIDLIKPALRRNPAKLIVMSGTNDFEHRIDTIQRRRI